MTENKKLLRIKAIRIQNIGRIESCDLEFDANERAIPVRGKNGAGKSTLFKIFNTIESGRNIPAEAITHGKEEGGFEIELEPVDGNGDILEIRRKFNANGKKSMTAMEGEYKRNQTDLTALVGGLRDPLKLVNMVGTELLKKVLPMVDMGGFSLDDNRAALAGAEEDRRIKGREVKRLEGAVKTAKAELGSFDADAPGVESLLDEIEEATQLQNTANEKGRELEDCRNNYRRADRDREVTETKLVGLKEKLAEIQQEISNCHQDAKEIKEEMDALATEGDNLKAEYDEAVAAVPDMEALQAKRETARQNDLKRGQAKELDELKNQLQVARNEHGEADFKVEDVRTEAKEALAAANWPAAGMSYDLDSQDVRLHGSLWDQASTGERMTAAVEICVAQPSPLRVFWLENAALLDMKHELLLDGLLDKHNYWAFKEMVDDNPNEPDADGNPKSGVAIENGQMTRCGKASK